MVGTVGYIHVAISNCSNNILYCTRVRHSLLTMLTFLAWNRANCLVVVVSGHHHVILRPVSLSYLSLLC